MKFKAILCSMAIIGGTIFTASAQSDTNKMDSQGRKQGIWVENLGPTKWQGIYIDGKKVGVWVSHHYNGIMDELIEYKDGKKDGIDVCIDVNGYYKSEKSYKGDSLDGLATEYFPGGNHRHKYFIEWAGLTECAKYITMVVE